MFTDGRAYVVSVAEGDGDSIMHYVLNEKQWEDLGEADIPAFDFVCKLEDKKLIQPFHTLQDLVKFLNTMGLTIFDEFTCLAH